MEKQAILSYQEFNEEKFTKRIIYKAGESTVFILNFMPGQQLPPHKHPGTEVYILALQGSGTMTVDGNDTSMLTNDVIHLKGEEEFSFQNSGDQPVSLYVMLNKIPSEQYAQNI